MRRKFWGILLFYVTLVSAGFSPRALGANLQGLDQLELSVFGVKYSGEPLPKRVTRLETALNRKPEEPSASLSLRVARLLALQQEMGDGAQVSRAISSYNTGVDLAAAGKTEDAAEAYRQAIEYDPALIEAYNNLGSLLEKRKDYTRAAEIYRRAIAKDPDNALLYRNLGVVYGKLGNMPESMAAYKNYLAHTTMPDEPVAILVKNYEATFRHPMNADADYLALIDTRDKKLLWPQRPNPVTVYISPKRPEDVQFLPAVRRGIAAWSEALDGQIDFEETMTPDNADVVVVLQPGPLSHPYQHVGRTNFSFDNLAHALTVRVTVNTGEADDEAMSFEAREAQVSRLLLHEFGHAIGLWGHSSNPEDIMYTHPIASQLSQRDIRTVRKLYNMEETRVEKWALEPVEY